MIDFMQEIRAHAASLGLTPLQLCRMAGVADSTWYHWLDGTFTPQVRTLERLLAYRPTPAKRGIAQPLSDPPEMG